MKTRALTIVGLTAVVLTVGGCKVPEWITGKPAPITVEPVATCAGFQDVPTTRDPAEFVKATLDGVRACLPVPPKEIAATQATLDEGATCTLEEWWDADKATIGPGDTDFLIVYCPEKHHIVFSAKGLAKFMQERDDLYNASRLIMWAFYAGVAAVNGQHNNPVWRAALEGVVAECLLRGKVLAPYRLADLRDRGQYQDEVYDKARSEAASRCKAA